MSQPWDYEYRYKNQKQDTDTCSKNFKEKVKSALWGMTMVTFVYVAIIKHIVKPPQSK